MLESPYLNKCAGTDIGFIYNAIHLILEILNLYMYNQPIKLIYFLHSAIFIRILHYRKHLFSNF